MRAFSHLLSGVCLTSFLLSASAVKEDLNEGVEEEVTEECSKTDHEAMQEEFSACSSSYSKEYHDTRGKLERPGDIQAATCLLLSRTIDTCGGMWSRCHGEEDIRKMKDMHIIHLIHQYSNKHEEDLGINVNQCEVVREYRESGREEEAEYEEDELCSNSHGIRVQSEYLECSHSRSKQLQESVVDVTDRQVVTNSLCKALTSIATICVKILNECFSVEYVENVRNHQIKEMKDYLYKLVEERVSNKTLAKCKILKSIVTQEQQVYEDYDDTNDIDGNQPINKEEGNEFTDIDENVILEEHGRGSSSSSPQIVDSELESNDQVRRNKPKEGKENLAVISKSARASVLIGLSILMVSY